MQKSENDYIPRGMALLYIAEMCGRGRKLFEHPQMDADAKFCLAVDADADTLH